MSWDFIYRGETINLDDAARRTATSGSFIRLPDGYTHFELGGLVSDRPVVLVHGFSVPYFIWDPTFEGLVSSGFHVLRYDLFGRGFSDRPYLKYNIDLFVKQLEDLLDSLNFEYIDLVGLSMGGAIAAAYTVHSPERVNKLVLIDPIGIQPMPLNFLYKLAILPGISETILGLFGTENMVKGLASDFFDRSHVELFLDRYRSQMKIKGFKRAILSTLRNKSVGGFPEVYERLGMLKLPIMILWGRNDQTIPLTQSGPLLKLVSPKEFHIVDGCGHIPHYEKPEIVNSLITDFLGK
jgi:pimeloyl-ACP methyl ester carboxylesterase